MKTDNRNCCTKRSILEKILIVVVVLLLCLLIALFTIFILHLQNGKRSNFIRYQTVTSSPTEQSEAAFLTSSSVNKPKRPTVCDTQQCVKAAAQIIDFVDPSVDPCDDFYKFVCGNFLNRSKEVNEVTPLSKLHDATLSQLDSLITEPVSEPIPKSLQLQRQYYKVCMDTEAIEYDNSYTLLNLFKQLGDWPVLLGRYWNDNKFSWWKSMLDCRKIGFVFDHFVSLFVVDISKNGTGPMVLSISPPAVINVPYQFKEFYIDTMANISIDLGAPNYLAKSEFARVFEFELEIKTLVDDERQHGQDTILTISKLQSQIPQIQWKDFLNEITKAPVPFVDDTVVHMRAGRFLPNLQSLLANTPVSTQANYVAWKIIENFRHYLKESVRARYETFVINTDPNYASVNNNRYVYCLNNAKFYFPVVAELAYVRKYLQPYKRQSIKQMTSRIKTELIKKIKANDWLDEASKNQFISQVSKAEEHIGSSDFAYNGDFDKVVGMDEFDLVSDNIMEMTTQLYAKRTDNYFRIVNRQSKEIEREALEKTPVLSINAFFNEPFNTLVVPAPFLQGLIYNFQRPQYMNHGSLGSVIGHELTHSFITKRDDGLWSPESKQTYEAKVQCLLDDYQRYNGHLKEFTKNGRSALQENIADLIGPEISYLAYKEWTGKQGTEQTLPSLPYSPNQVFWIMSAAFKCYVPNLKQNIRFDDQHGVPSFGVTFSMKNSPDFAADFNCPEGSNMNPYYKCRIL